MSIEELSALIESYPRRIADAMDKVAKAELVVEYLQDQILIEEQRLAAIARPDDIPVLSEERVLLLRLSHDLELLELECDRVRGQLELDYRRALQDEANVSDALIVAHINSNPLFIAAKKTYLEKKYLHQLTTLKVRATKNEQRPRSEEDEELLTSPALERLHGRLSTAVAQLETQQRILEEIKVSIVSCRLLVQLYVAGLIS